MNKINKKDIDFSKMERVESLSIGLCPNDLYKDEETGKIYKMFSNLDKEKRLIKEKKLQALDELDCDYVSKAIDLIYNYDMDLVGYSQKLIKGNTLHNEITNKGILSEMKTILEVSKHLEELHKNDIVVSYMHFGNVLVDENEESKFISADNYQIKDLKTTGTTLLLNKYFDQKRKKLENNSNTDIIGFYLSFFNEIFKREITNMKPESYNSYLSNPFLQELYPVFFELNKRNGEIPEVPYLHKVLKNYDI